MAVITLEKVKKQYANVQVLNDIDLQIEEKEFISIVGKSGSGKSTLLYIMGGLEEPSNGKVIVDNKDLYRLNDVEKSTIRTKHIGFVFQFYNLVQNLTVEENILLPSLMMGKKKEDLTDKLDQLLHIIGLNGKETNRPNELSGGQQQRVAIARAVMNGPEILLADELTGNLDSTTGLAVMDILKTINEELHTTIIHVTHNPELLTWGNRVITLADGSIVSDERM